MCGLFGMRGRKVISSVHMRNSFKVQQVQTFESSLQIGLGAGRFTNSARAWRSRASGGRPSESRTARSTAALVSRPDSWNTR